MESEGLLKRKAGFSLLAYALLFGILLAVLFVKCNLQDVKGEWSSTEPIYIRADGTIEPANAPVSTSDKNIYTLTDNIIGNYGIIVERWNIILDGAGYALIGNLIPDSSSTGISMYGANDNIVKNIEIKGFSQGISVTGSGNKITGNKITENLYGVRCGGSNNEISQNDIISNQHGIRIDGSGDAFTLIKGNKIKINQKGIELGGTSSNIIFGNIIENNGWYQGGCGVELEYYFSNFNIFYHNDFINNSQQVIFISESTNYWDNGFASGGNYWSDYVGVDLYSGIFQNETCRDGIGDTAYHIGNQNVDSYPLIKPWQEHVNPPVARFRFFPEVGYALQEMAFNSSSSYDLDENIKSYSWNFADGNITTTNNPLINHAFNLPGLYEVALTVYDEKDLSTTFSQSVRIIATSFISLATIPSSTTSDFSVNITGVLEDMFKNPLSGELVLLHYTFEGAGEWFPLVSATTDDFGRFETAWFPQATGQYAIKAEWKGNDTYAPTQKITNLDIIAHQEKYLFSVESNSTISSLTFESDNNELKFVVTGSDGTEGYVRVTIAKSIIADIQSVEVKLNDAEIDYVTSLIDDSWQVYFTYQHSSHTVIINLGGTLSLFGLTVVDFAIMGLVIAIVCAVAVFLVFRRRRVKKS